MLKFIRTAALFLLATVASIGIFSAPLDSLPPAIWLLALLASKAIGVAAGYAAYRLNKDSQP